MKKSKQIYCCGCKKITDCELVTGKQIYPNLNNLSTKSFYICICGLYVGCHQNTENPLGTIPTEEMRVARKTIHKAIDQLWKNKLISRKKIYSFISKEIGFSYHTGATKSIEECRKVCKIALDLHVKLLRREPIWGK